MEDVVKANSCCETPVEEYHRPLLQNLHKAYPLEVTTALCNK